MTRAAGLPKSEVKFDLLNIGVIKIYLEEDQVSKELALRFPSLDWNKTLHIVLVAALLLPLMALRPMSSVPSRIQPALLELAAARPNERVSVIVQKTMANADVEEQVTRLGGVVTRDLRIIHAVAAQLPAQAAVELGLAPTVRWVSLDAPMIHAGKKITTTSLSTSALVEVQPINVYPATIQVDQVWAMSAGAVQGQGIAVAVIDSGITAGHPDFLGQDGASRVVASVYLNPAADNADDGYGHGTHVAGIIGGNGQASGGAFTGVAPQVNLVNVKVSDDAGNVTTSDVVAGMQWVYEHADQYNIRVVNLSVNSSMDQSYNVDPLDAAAEILWFNKIVVVTAAGNLGKHALYPPANDPFVITVGAADDMGTPKAGDDMVAGFSAYGKTGDGFVKPDLVAPGVNLISTLAGPDAILAQEHADHMVSDYAPMPAYFRMSGTSTAAPVVAGVAALILQQNPNLTPDQVKFRLKKTARAYVLQGGAITMGAGYLDAYSAVTGTSAKSENTGTPASQLLWTGSAPLDWTSANWGSANWGSANWGSANWGSANWGSANWGGDFWDN
jgi:serine protease AprX